MQKYLISYNSGRAIVTCETKSEAIRIAKHAQKLLGWTWFEVTVWNGAKQ